MPFSYVRLQSLRSVLIVFIYVKLWSLIDLADGFQRGLCMCVYAQLKVLQHHSATLFFSTSSSSRLINSNLIDVRVPVPNLSIAHTHLCKPIDSVQQRATYKTKPMHKIQYFMYEHAAYSVWCSPFVQMTIKQSAMKKVRNEQMHEKNRQQSSRSIDEANGERRKKEREERSNSTNKLLMHLSAVNVVSESVILVHCV